MSARKLLLARHGKALEHSGDFRDWERPLTEEGVNNTRKTADELRKQLLSPDLIISSQAIRAISTALILAECLNYPFEKVRIDNHIYAHSATDMLKTIHRLDDTCRTVMVVGHNPGMSELASSLANRPVNLSTSDIAEFNLTAESWSNLNRSCCTFIRHIHSR